MKPVYFYQLTEAAIEGGRIAIFALPRHVLEVRPTAVPRYEGYTQLLFDDGEVVDVKESYDEVLTVLDSFVRQSGG